VGQVASIPEVAVVGRRRRPVPERAVYVPATTARLIPGSRSFATGAKKPPQSVAAGGLFRASAFPPKFSPNALSQFLPAFVRQLSPRMLSALLMDASILCGTFLVAHALLSGVLDTATAAAYLCLFLAAGMQEGLYSQNQRNASAQFLLVKTSLWASLVTILVLQRTARGAAGIALLALGSAGVSGGWRWMWEKASGAASHSTRNVLLVGDPARMQAVAAALQSDPRSGRCVKGMLPDWQLYDVHGFDVLRTLAREKHIDEIVLASHDPNLARSVLSECSRSSLDLLIAPEVPEGGVLQVENLAGLPLLKIHEQLSPEWRLTVKRVIDAVLAAVGLALAFPLMCLIAVAIKLESCGPFLYRAPRIGHKGRLFVCYKFRTMVSDADRIKDQLRLRNERQGAFFKIERDPRITRVGRWLRRYSLDELPQLANVLLGDMSLVGPRPHPPDDVERYRLEDLQRLDATPGMTGLWQVTARNDPSFQRCIALDVEYIRHWDLLLDFRILGKTLAAVLHGSGA
jgi:exopolysaccharide biosynthesis polyprenyl glycosylphosphotransferase